MVDPGLSASVAALKSRIAVYTVDRLKAIIQAFNEHCGSNLSRSGKKSELQDKLRHQLDSWELSNSIVSINTARKVLDHIDMNGTYNVNTLVQMLHLPSPTVARPPPLPPTTGVNLPQSNGASSSSTNGTYSSISRTSVPAIPFVASPFFEVEEPVSAITPCPESLNLHDRKNVSLTFTLSAEQREKLLSTTANYQLRLYCTSSMHYIQPTAFRPQRQTAPCLMEFPNTCEIRVNTVNLHAQTKGLKKKAGTAPPAHLGPNIRTNSGATNTVEMIYCNNNPVQGQVNTNNRKYFMQVNLVKTTSVQELVDRLRKGKYRSKEDVLVQRQKHTSDDDDIVAGPQKMSLKCPLSYVRIAHPARSSACVHPGCFDATSWYSMMEITTTWSCPICEKKLDLPEMIIDGYFDSILKSTPDDVEDVMVEADGEWHTLDNKYHSDGWIPPKTAMATTASSSSSTIARDSQSLPPLLDKVKLEKFDEPISAHAMTHATPAEEIVLDSDDDDVDAAAVRREIIPHQGNRAAPIRTSSDDVIDLTGDSDEESPLPPPTPAFNAGGKRKERSPPLGLVIQTALGDQSGKRARLDSYGRNTWNNRNDEPYSPANGGSGGGAYRQYGEGDGGASSAPGAYGRSSYSHNYNLPPLPLGYQNQNSLSHSPPNGTPCSPLLNSPTYRSAEYPQLPPIVLSNGRPPLAPHPTLRGLPPRPNWNPPRPSPEREYPRRDYSRPW